jgi:hypothetical protein
VPPWEQHLHAQLLRQEQRLQQQEQMLLQQRRLLESVRPAERGFCSSSATPDIAARAWEFSKLEEARFPGREPLREHAAAVRLAAQEQACYEQLDAEEAEWEAEADAAATRVEMDRSAALAAQQAKNQCLAEEDERWFREEFCTTYLQGDSSSFSSSSSSSSAGAPLSAGSTGAFNVQAAMSHSNLDALDLAHRPAPANSGEELHRELLFHESVALQARRTAFFFSSLPSPSSARGQHFDLSLISDEEAPRSDSPWGGCT